MGSKLQRNHHSFLLLTSEEEERKIQAVLSNICLHKLHLSARIKRHTNNEFLLTTKLLQLILKTSHQSVKIIDVLNKCGSILNNTRTKTKSKNIYFEKPVLRCTTYITCEHEGYIPSSITPQRLGRKLLIGSLDFIYMFLSFPFWFTPPSAARNVRIARTHFFPCQKHYKTFVIHHT